MQLVAEGLRKMEKIWFTYTLQKLNETGAPVTCNLCLPDKLEGKFTQINISPSAFSYSSYYFAKAPNLYLQGGVWFDSSEKLNKVNALEDLLKKRIILEEKGVLEEKITLGIRKEGMNKGIVINFDLGIVIDFNLNKDKARLDQFDKLNAPELTLNYLKDVDYDSKVVVDDLLGVFLNDCKRGSIRR